MQKRTYIVEFQLTGWVAPGSVSGMLARILEQESMRSSGYLTEVPKPHDISVSEVASPPLRVYRGAKLNRAGSDGVWKYTLASVGWGKWLLVSEDGCRWGDPFDSIQSLLEDLKHEVWTVTDPGSKDSETSSLWNGPTAL